MTMSELAEVISYPGNPRSLVAELPRIAAQYGLSAQKVYNPVTGKPKRDPRNDRALWLIKTLGPSDPRNEASTSENEPEGHSERRSWA
jgi:hypothetical protein